MKLFSCKEAARRVSMAVEQPLALQERIAVSLHLVMCSHCRNFQRQLAFLRQAVRVSRDLPSERKQSARLPPEAKERIKQALENNRD